MPENRAVLLTGEPGVGKSTLAMQYLQTGLRDGEQCVYVSTEQTLDEIADSFAPFEFDLDHEGLTIGTLHTQPGGTIENADALRLTTLAGENVTEGIPVPFENAHVANYLRDFGPADRVAFDSITALRPIIDGDALFSRAVLDLIHLFTNEFEATTLLTAERNPENTDLGNQYKTHGVISLWRDMVGGEDHLFTKINKLRGVDHDRRTFATEFTSTGLRTIPRLETVANAYLDIDLLSTGVIGLDDLTGGGVPKGGVNLLKTDGLATIRSFLANLQTQAVEEGYAVAVIPPLELDVDRLCSLFDRQIGDVDTLLAEDRLFILDMISERDPIHENHLVYQDGEYEPTEAIQEIFDRKGYRPLFATVHAHSFFESIGEQELRNLRTWSQANLISEQDVISYVMNPRLVSDQFVAYLEDTSRQVLSTYLKDGLQYIELEKSPSGYLGSTRLVEYLDHYPFVRVQSTRNGF
ncbi:ATPase domain-containing protein [Haladaptatus sp. GCM10025893]|uniref:ATPase domain-containing protein n=1 Tax=Haladaptatus sp. GCM10025893 TaxID=3252659 RepID=UPI00360895CD